MSVQCRHYAAVRLDLRKPGPNPNSDVRASEVKIGTQQVSPALVNVHTGPILFCFLCLLFSSCEAVYGTDRPTGKTHNVAY